MKSLITVAVLCVSMCAVGCSREAAEQVGEAMDSAGDAASSAVEQAGEAASDAATSVAEATESAVETAKQGVEEGFAALSEKASAALAGIEGGPELLKSVTTYFDSAKEALGGITDTESAKAAMAKLTDLGGTIDGLSESMAKLPEAARTALAGVIASGTAGLKALFEKAMDIPGVRDVIKPKFDEVMQKLSALVHRQ